MSEPGDLDVITVSDKARAHIDEILEREPDRDKLALWIEVVGAQGVDYAYDLFFAPIDEAAPDDAVRNSKGLVVVVPATSVDKLQGATLDMNRNLLSPGLVLTNPSRPPSQFSSPAIADRELVLEGDVDERVTTVLEVVINPSIASHGGRADLVAVEDGIAYLRLSGGCQGCGMASVTLSQGIEVALREHVPEISRVVDVTDHAGGSNPYYQPAKK